MEKGDLKPYAMDEDIQNDCAQMADTRAGNVRQHPQG